MFIYIGHSGDIKSMYFYFLIIFYIFNFNIVDAVSTKQYSSEIYDFLVLIIHISTIFIFFMIFLFLFLYGVAMFIF